MNSIKYFTAEEIKQLRKPVSLSIKGPQGWSKCKVEPLEVLKAFPVLHLKNGFVLRAYQFREGGNGNAVVWAMPEDSPFPEPDCCQKLKDAFLEPPRPPEALDDLMEVIEGDGSHWSYLSASIFLREMNEFGAMWHGCEWSTHEIIDKDPSDYFNRAQEDAKENISPPRIGKWKWLKDKPDEWQPSVCKGKKNIIVTFYSYSGLGVDVIYLHVDTFQPRKYSFKTKKVMIAKGGGGYIF